MGTLSFLCSYMPTFQLVTEIKTNHFIFQLVEKLNLVTGYKKQRKEAVKMTSVEIPLQGSDTEVIEIAFDELPDDVEEVMHILKAEKAQMHLWVTIAIEYFRRDKKQNFTKVGLISKLDIPVKSIRP